MNHTYSVENLRKATRSTQVPTEPGVRFVFEVDDFKVKLNRPYINKEGDENPDLFLVMVENNGPQFSYVDEEGVLVVLYRSSPKEEFEYLNKDTPLPILETAFTYWNTVIEEMRILDITDGYLNTNQSYYAYQKHIGKPIPRILEGLFICDKLYGMEGYSESFGLVRYKKSGISSWSSDPTFLNSFTLFARANGTGSMYAFWNIDPDLEKCPIVVFGDEGGVYLVCETLTEFIHLLSFDNEISVSWEDAYFYHNEEYYEETYSHPEFLEWIKEEYSLDKITEEGVETIIEGVRQKYGNAFNEFLLKYGVVQG